MIADAKRGDIAGSAAAYAQAVFGGLDTPFGRSHGLGADAVTHQPAARPRRARAVRRRRRAATAPACSCSCARPTRARRTSSTPSSPPAARCGSGSRGLVAEVGTPGPESGLAEVGAVTGATVPEHLARMRELMPHTPFLLPGIGAQGGRVADLAPGVRPGPRGRAGQRLALDRERARGGGRRARRGRSGGGRAAARAGLVAGLSRPDARRGGGYHRWRWPDAAPRASSRRSRWWPSRWPCSSSSRTRRRTTRAPPRRTPGSRRRSTATPTGQKKQRKQPRSYTVKAGDTPSGIAEKVNVPLETILELNPDLDPQTLTPGHRDQAALMRAVVASLVAALLAALALAAPARAARGEAAARDQRAVGDPDRGRDRRRAVRARRRQAPRDRVDHQADDRAAHDGAREALRQRPGVELRGGADRVQAEPAARGGAVRRRPAARADARVRQRRGGHARRARRRQPRRVRAADEPARARAQAEQHALRQPDRARRRGQLLVRARPREARRRAAQAQLRAQDRQPHVGHAHDRRAGRARSATATRCSRRTAKVNGLKTGHTSTAGYVLVGTRRHERITLVSVVLGTPSLAARDADSLALLQVGRGLLPRDPPGEPRHHRRPSRRSSSGRAPRSTS